MDNPRFVITIGRQFGSGGREMGKKLSELFGISYYDKELLAEISRESGLSTDFLENTDEQMPRPMVQTIAMDVAMTGNIFGMEPFMPKENLFKLQSDVIRDIAARESCVIVGRCADYILRDHPLCINTFICCQDEERVRRIKSAYPSRTEREIEDQMKKTDKKRAAYYEFYTAKTWGQASSYDLCMDSTILGVETSARWIESYVEKRIEHHRSLGRP